MLWALPYCKLQIEVESDVKLGVVDLCIFALNRPVVPTYRAGAASGR